MPEELYSPVSSCTYSIRGLLGQGGSGSVYRVFCSENDEFYALKVSYEDEVSKAALRREGDILSSVVHPAFPAVREIWEGNEQVYLVMTYISGRTLAMRMEEQLLWHDIGFEPDVVLPWMLQLSDCLEYLHKHRIVYRDLKPSNVMIDAKGHLFIVDFGTVYCQREQIAEQEITKQGMGTPGFAPPEQYSQVSGPGVWTDIYSFGAVLHFLLTGEHPAEHLFQFRKLSECLQADEKLNRRERACRIRQVKILEQLIEACTVRETEKRCHSWRKIRHDLYCAQSRILHRKKRWLRQFILGSAAVFLVVYLVVMRGYGQLDQDAYNRCLIKAERAEPQEAEALILEAIELDSEKSEAYASMYDLFLKDGMMSVAEWQKIQSLLLSNRDCFDMEEPEWVILAYKIGMAVYFQSEEQISGSQAVVWFQKVEEADMQKLNLGEYDTRKYVWQKRAAIFRRWSQAGINSDVQVERVKESKQFWQDVNGLLEDDFSEEERAWELGIYNRILSRMMEELTMGIDEHIVSKKEIAVVFDKMNQMLDQINEEQESYTLREQILEKENVLKKRLALIQ